MNVSPDAMTILVGLLNDLALVQRKITAGQGASCDLALDECDGEYIITLGVTVDAKFVPHKHDLMQPGQEL